MCFMVNERWCADSTVLSSSCYPNVEMLIVECKPFYLPGEFTSLVLVGAYIYPEETVATAISELSKQVSDVQNYLPDSLVLVLI